MRQGHSRFLLLVLTAQFALIAAAEASSKELANRPVTVLLVVAHPDDEYEMAGTVYRIAKELGGNVDEIIVTNGEAGYHYSSLAASYYGVNLTDEAVGRARLPGIRQEEARAAAKVLGIRHQWFLNEKDDRFTLDLDEVIRHSWDPVKVRQALRQHLDETRYDFVFVLLPTADTHGAHKAASVLALETVAGRAADQRPIVLGVQAGASRCPSYRALAGYPFTASNSSTPNFEFDRNTRFGYQESLSYQIVVDWLIAAHKTQGLLQTRCLQDRFENFWLFSINQNTGTSPAESVFAAVTREPTGKGNALANLGTCRVASQPSAQPSAPRNPD